MLELVNFDKLFMDTPEATCLPITDLTTPASIRTFIATLCSTPSDQPSFRAQCDCGLTVGNFYENAVCSVCKTPVHMSFSTQLRYKTWIDIPPFVPPVLHPAIYEMFVKVLGKVPMPPDVNVKGLEQRPLIDLLLDINGILPQELQEHVPTGMFAFHEHFWEILDNISKYYHQLAKLQRQEAFETLVHFLQTNKDKIFVRKLPCLDPSLHLLTQHGGITLTDDASPILIEAITALSGVIHTHTMKNDNQRLLDEKLYTFYMCWILYPRIIKNTKLLSKRGLLRRTGCGCRTHGSFRGVIVPIFTPHDGDVLHIPWKIAIRILRLEILNLMMNRNKIPFNEAIKSIYAAETTFSESIHHVMMTLIKECPYKGLPVLFNRNPSIQLGCVQLLFITEVGTDVNDTSIGVSARIIKAPNADFDGDQMNGFPIKEMGMIPELMKVHPMCTMLGGDEPTITDNVMITSQEAVVLQAFLEGEQVCT